MDATAAAFLGRHFTGTVTRSTTASMPWAAPSSCVPSCPIPISLLPAGMFMQLAVELERRDAVTIPEEAVVVEGDQAYVFLIANGKATRRDVKLGLREPGIVEITHGLKTGDLVITRGIQRVREGSPVEASQISPRPRRCREGADDPLRPQHQAAGAGERDEHAHHCLRTVLRLPLRELPDVDTSVVTVTTEYTGANPATVDTDITEIIESGVAGISGIKTISSQSRQGVSSTTIEFEVGRNIDEAANDVSVAGSANSCRTTSRSRRSSRTT